MFPLVELKVHVWVLCQCHRVWWKLLQTGVFSCLWVRSPLSLAPLMILWMEMMQGVSMMVIWVNSAVGVMMQVMQGVFEVGQVHQIAWIWCPYSLCPGNTQSSPCWADGHERNCFWAVSSLFSPDGLERRYHHDIWALNVLYFFCRLCHWGPGPCTNIHIPRLQSLCQSSIAGDLSLAYWGRTVLAH